MEENINLECKESIGMYINNRKKLEQAVYNVSGENSGLLEDVSSFGKYVEGLEVVEGLKNIVCTSSSAFYQQCIATQTENAQYTGSIKVYE